MKETKRKRSKGKSMKRIFSLLIIVALLAGMFPASVMAEEESSILALPYGDAKNEYEVMKDGDYNDAAYEYKQKENCECEHHCKYECEIAGKCECAHCCESINYYEFAYGEYQAITPLGQVLVKPFPCDPNYCTRFYKQDAEISCDCTNPDAAHMLMNAHWGIDGESLIARTFPKNWVFTCDTLQNEPNPPAQRRVYIHWPIIPGFTVEVIAKYNQARINQWEYLFPQFFPMGTAIYQFPDRLSRNLESHFYISAPGGPGHMVNAPLEWAFFVANVRTRTSTVQLQTRDLHLNYESGQENVGLRTNAVAGAYDINDIANYFTHNAHIENRTFSAPALNFQTGAWADGFPQSAAPLTLKIPALPNGERAFEFYFECPDTPGTWIQSYDFTTGVLGGLNEGYCYNIRHIFDSLPIRPKTNLPAGVHQTDVRIYQYGWVWSGTQPAFGSPPDYMPTLRYVWLGAVPIPGSNHVLLNPDNGQFRVTFEVDPCPQGQLPSDVNIEKNNDANEPVRAGNRVTYTITITNDGPGVANNVVVTDALPAGLRFENAEIVYPIPVPAGANLNFNLLNRTLTLTLPTLAVDASVEIEVEVTVTQATAGAITNTAYVTVNGNPADDDSSTINVLSPLVPLEPDVKIEKTSDADAPVRAGDTVIYTLTVTNEGLGVANNVVVTDALPAGLRFEYAEIVYPTPVPPGAHVGFNILNRTLTVTIPTLATDASVEIEVEVTVTQATAGAITNTAYVTVNGNPADNCSSTINVLPPDGQPQPAVTITKSVLPVNVTAGSNVNYTLVVRNSGEVPLTALTVTDALPEQLTNPRNLIVPAGATYYGFNEQTLSVTLAELAPNASVTITFTATVAAGTAVGTQINNIATVHDVVTNVSATDNATVTVIAPDNNGGNGGGGGGNGGGGGTPPPQPPVEITPPEAPLVGMSPYHYAYIIGYPDGFVRPANNITRAEVATIFFRLISDEQRVNIWSQSNPFPDVILQNWFNNAISTLTNANLLYGYPDGYFRPNQSMTRAEFAAVIVRIMGERGAMSTATNSFIDVSGHWGEAYISVAYMLGWVQGYGDGTFRPNQPITRAEVAALVNRALHRRPEHCDDLLPDMVRWPDNMNVDAWYYLYIQEATNSHYHEMKADGIHETWTELITPREWWRLERPDSNPRIFTGADIGAGMGMDY